MISEKFQLFKQVTNDWKLSLYFSPNRDNTPEINNGTYTSIVPVLFFPYSSYAGNLRNERKLKLSPHLFSFLLKLAKSIFPTYSCTLRRMYQTKDDRYLCL